MAMFGKLTGLVKASVLAFIEDGALTYGAAIAYYTIFSIAPVLLIVIAIAGLVFGRDAAQGAIVAQLSGLMGQQSAEALQSMLKSAGNTSSGTLATVIGVGTLLVTASGVFGEMQTAINAIWKAKPRSSTVSRLIRARIVSLGLVMALGFLLMVSLVLSAALAAVGTYLYGIFPGIHLLLQIANFAISFALISLLFAAIYKFLPDTPIEWRDVTMGAVVTALLFTIGKTLIGLYIGSSKVASSYGAAGALIVILLWIYYSAQIFLLGAEFTKCYAHSHGSKTLDQAAPRANEAVSFPYPAASHAPSREGAAARSTKPGFLLTILSGLIMYLTFTREWRRRSEKVSLRS
jgi:membrane protein